MEINQTVHSRLRSLVSPANFWTAALLLVLFLAGLWVGWAEDPIWQAVPLVAVAGLTAVAGITWQRSRARAQRGWHAALTAHADREIQQQRRRTAPVSPER
jgi:hypothetical protein